MSPPPIWSTRIMTWTERARFLRSHRRKLISTSLERRSPRRHSYPTQLRQSELTRRITVSHSAEARNNRVAGLTCLNRGKLREPKGDAMFQVSGHAQGARAVGGERQGDRSSGLHQGTESRSHAPAGMILLVASLLISVLIAACVPSGNLDLCDLTDNDFSWKGPDLELMNTRIELVDFPTSNAGTLWLKGCVTGQQSCLPDQLTVKWDTFTV